MSASKNKTRSHGIFIFALFILCGWLFSCTKIDEEAWKSTPIQNPILLGTVSCQPPCWNEEFLIGETSFDQARTQIERFQESEPSSRIVISEHRRYITWIRDDSSIVLRFIDDKLFFINFNSKTVDLGSIVAHFGSPNNYFISENRFGYTLETFYPEHGIIFSSVNDFSPVSETMIVDKFTFYDPEYNLDSFLDQYYGYDLDQVYEGLFQWQGFGVCPEGLEFPETCVSD